LKTLDCLLKEEKTKSYIYRKSNRFFLHIERWVSASTIQPLWNTVLLRLCTYLTGNEKKQTKITHRVHIEYDMELRK
jgi:hypothetical protein